VVGKRAEKMAVGGGVGGSTGRVSLILFFSTTPSELAAIGPAWAAAVSSWTCPANGQCDPCGAGTGFWGAWPHIDCRTPGASANEKAGGGRVSNIHFTESATGDIAAAVDALCSVDQAKEFDVSTARGAAPVTGEIPKALATCFPRLHKMKINFGALTGPLPAWLGDGQALPSLSYIKLNDNKLTGPIPAEWGANKQLFWLDVSNNSGIGGSIPQTFAKHPSLGVFRAANAGLTGEITGLAGAPLQVVDLSGNPGLCGPVPESVRWAHGFDTTGTGLGKPCQAKAGVA
jgi:hypothetical protein